MNAKTNPTKFEQTYLQLVLDRSGSMASCRLATIKAVNQYLLEARQDSALKEADLTLTTFDSEAIEDIRSGAPVRVVDLTPEDYQPRASTPLYDAIGRGIDTLDAKLAASGSGKAILVIVTDGQENASRKYNHGAISELIKAREAAGWLVIFLAADLAAAKTAQALGVSIGTVSTMDFHEAGLASSMGSIRRMSSGYAATASSTEAKQWKASAEGRLSAKERKDMGDVYGSAPDTNAKPRDPSVGLAAEGDTWEADKAKKDAWTQ